MTCFDLNCRGECGKPSGYWDNGSAIPQAHIKDHAHHTLVADAIENWAEFDCAIHNVREDVPNGEEEATTWCPECWHTYPDDWALLAEYNRYHIETDSCGRKTDVDTIFFCPLCLHDF